LTSRKPHQRRILQQTLRRLFAFLPKQQRFAVYRGFVDCDPAPSDRLLLKIADTREELEACFRLLHDAYVDSGFMKPDPSGMPLPSIRTFARQGERSSSP